MFLAASAHVGDMFDVRLLARFAIAYRVSEPQSPRCHVLIDDRYRFLVIFKEPSFTVSVDAFDEVCVYEFLRALLIAVLVFAHMAAMYRLIPLPPFFPPVALWPILVPPFFPPVALWR